MIKLHLAVVVIISGVIICIVIPSGIVPAVFSAMIGRPGPWWGSFKEEVCILTYPSRWLLMSVKIYLARNEIKGCTHYGKRSVVFNVECT
jgi:hypothetical protein